MLRDKRFMAGWQGASLVAITYVYFLIFAQFAFLAHLARHGIAGPNLNAVMASMAIGGILVSLLAPRLRFLTSPNLRLRIAFGACGAAALFAYLPLNVIGAAAVAFLIGIGLGLLTVTLVTHLRRWTGRADPLLIVGLGTGIAYLICNLPFFFAAPAHVQTLTASALCLAGIGVTLLPAQAPREIRQTVPPASASFLRVLIGFTTLVWLDSAAFFIIQHTPALKAGTWEGGFHLWTNAGLHFVAALASVLLLKRKGLVAVFIATFTALGAACILLLHPAGVLLASLLYPIGVSLYSVSLVAYPSLLASAESTAARGRIAGWLYAIAGWLGSAMGIGMGQNLGHVPPLFVAAAGLAILVPSIASALSRRRREALLTAVVLLSAAFCDRFDTRIHGLPSQTQIERGRQVYISEGCIDCHSQYVRPNSPDVLMWGPASSLQQIRSENPPLIGNRRQGPDLAEVGARRSALWLKAHFFNPSEVSGSSIMPSYGFLFRDQRGEDLIAYLESLGAQDVERHFSREAAWRPSAVAIAGASLFDGERLYQKDCTTCHSENGATRLMWRTSFKRSPSDLEHGSFHYLSVSDTRQDRTIRVAQIVKFGIPETDMPGHEYLSDRDIASLSVWLAQHIGPPEN